MKKSLLLVTSILFFVFASYAQDHPDQKSTMSAEERAENITREINKHISLTEEQRSAVNQTWIEFFTDMQDIWQSGRVSRSSFRKSLHEREQVRDLKMKGILDEKQYTQYEDFLKAVESSGRGNRRRK